MEPFLEGLPLASRFAEVFEHGTSGVEGGVKGGVKGRRGVPGHRPIRVDLLATLSKAELRKRIEEVQDALVKCKISHKANA
jgi:hypothetical protein